MKDTGLSIRTFIDELISRGAERSIVLAALNKISLELITTLQNERKIK